MAWAPDYATPSEVKAYVRVDDDLDDVQVALAIAAASRAVDQHCGRQFGAVDTAEERHFSAVWDRRRSRWLVEVDDFADDAITVQVAGGAITPVTFEPVNAGVKGRPWQRLVVDSSASVVPTVERDSVSVTAVWGWASVPTPVKQATLLQASRFLARRDSPFGVAGSPTLGSELRLLARVDVDVAVILGPFKRWWAAA